MNSELLEAARPGLEARHRGDIDALAALLDPEVQLTWWEAGDWDCRGREAVLALLRERTQQGAGAAEIELIDAGSDAIVAARKQAVIDGPQAGLRPATVITFRNGLAISMRQFRSCEEALAAVERK
jgi:ketosteroid isomerase-like protein